MLRQLDLFATGAPAFDPTFRGRHRIELAAGAWIDHVPGWVSGHDALFDQLERDLPWRHEQMKMYDRLVDVPRLLAIVDPATAPLLAAMRDTLSHAYDETFLYISAALYRTGADSVAMHGDTTARNMLQSLVATVSLGAPRRFLMKPAEGGPSQSLPLGRGDLVVMGGTSSGPGATASPRWPRPTRASRSCSGRPGPTTTEPLSGMIPNASLDSGAPSD